jgi:hypothetical protein
VRKIQPALMLPDVAAWRRLDALVMSLENDCRRLHAKFLHRQPAVRVICERVMRANGAAPARRAVAS